MEKKVDITEIERTINYVQFQIHQANEMLAPFANADKSKICYVHLLDWKNELQEELHALRQELKAQK